MWNNMMWNNDNPYPHSHPDVAAQAAALMAAAAQQRQQQQQGALLNHHPSFGHDHHNGIPSHLQQPPHMHHPAEAYQGYHNHDSESDDDDDDDDDDSPGKKSAVEYSRQDDSDDSDDDEGDPDSQLELPSPKVAAAAMPQQPRGKPEAMAKKLASAVRRQEKMEEVKMDHMDTLSDDDIPLESLVTHSAKVKKKKSTSSPKGTKTSPKKKTSAKSKRVGDASTSTPSKKKSPSKKKRSSTGTAASSTSPTTGRVSLAGLNLSNLPTMDDPVEPITETQYVKLEELMIQFCKVPLLAEFSRPVSVLHPELMSVYTKIIDHPIDLGKVCRRIRRRQYENLRDVRLDVWRIFANCTKFNSHSSNKGAVPSFVSIALHLRDYFNDLWQEHMLPSDFPPPAPQAASAKAKKPPDPNATFREAMEQRAKDRRKRLIVSGLSVMSGKSLERARDQLQKLLRNGGRVDILDKRSLWGDSAMLEDDDESDMDVVVENLKKLEAKIVQTLAQGEELGVDELDAIVRKSYTEGDGLENMNSVLRIQLAGRMDRFIGQLIVPIHEATCRGVSQSSIWGCMAAAVWARESSKKPFWPALVLGIIAPQDQREDWHSALTERNEARLPEKLKTQLSAGKRKAEQAIKRQSLGQADPQSFFLVEFLGTHEFIWVREADIVENFNPAEDPNKMDIPGSKKKRISRSNLANILGSKTYSNAVEEAQWALEEFELQLQDVGGDPEEVVDVDGHAEEGYSFGVLSQSDEEAEGNADDDSRSKENLDSDECNELLATNGLLDFSAAGKKRRAQILKQHKADAEKKQKALKARKVKADKAKKAKESKVKEKEKKQEQRDLEKKRRKRMREREKALKGAEQQKKKIKLSDPAPGRKHQIMSKRERAEAIVDSYINRTAKKGDYKALSLGGGEEKWIASALIDSNNLSGMALAFRAASGLIPMPNPVTAGPGKNIIKLWDKIKVNDQKTSDERCESLGKQIELLEHEIKRVKKQKARRSELLAEAEQAVVDMDRRIVMNEKLARENPLKKSKKPHPLAGRKRKRTGDKAGPKPKKSDNSTDVDKAVETVEVEAVDSNDVDDTIDVVADADGDADEEDELEAEAVIAE